MGPRAGLDKCGKSRPPRGFDPRTVQPVASRYTDYTTRTQGYEDLWLFFEARRGPRAKAKPRVIPTSSGKSVSGIKPKIVGYKDGS